MSTLPVQQAPERIEWTRSVVALIAAFVAIKLALHFATSGGYGYFRDELYYIVCGERLDWGYVDHPPLTPLAARVGRAIFGQTMFAIRFFPAVSGAVTMLLAALTARELGGRRFAIAITCLCVLFAPHYLGSQAKLATDSLEPPFWAGCAFILLRIIRADRPRLWPWFGLIAGLGIEVKHSIVFYGFALLFALLLTPERRHFFNRYFVYAGLVAFALALPNLVWEWKNDWATYVLLSNISHSHKNVVLGPFAYFAQQLLISGPASSPVWLLGLFALVFRRNLRPYRVFAYSYLIALALFIILKGKNYYLAPAYPLLMAAGAVVIEQLTDVRLRWLRPVYAALLVLLSLPVLPLTLPILSPDAYIAYQKKLGITPPKTETAHTAILPQHFADRFGWDELADNVGRAYQSLSPADQARVGIYAQNYGEAGAIDVLGRKYGLPPAMSGHQNYFLWGTHGFNGELTLVIDDDRDDLDKQCDSVEDKGPALRNRFAMPWEQRRNIYLCRGLHPPLQQLWPQLKEWY